MDMTTHNLQAAFLDDRNRVPTRIETIDSTALIGDAKLIHIQHRGEIYSLRQTRLGKLILTK